MERSRTTEIRPGHGRGDVRDEVARYRQLHDETDGGGLDARKASYAEMVKGYYDLVTDFYTYGWGDSFHFAPRFRGEAFAASIARHQHFLASTLGLAKGMRVLDVGCGVGGPMRSIARFSGATIVGVNNNAYQIARARERNEAAGLAHLCEVEEADFMRLPHADGTFDAIYAVEATCHAPDKAALFRELFRVLEPGGQFAAYEWCLTPKYDRANVEHRRIKKGIEEGDGLPDIATIPETERALADAGFEILEVEDRAGTSDPETPWYLPITGRERTFTGIRRTPVGRRITWVALSAAERIGAVPRGTVQVSQFLHAGADALVAGGELGIFTPMLYFRVRKPH